MIPSWSRIWGGWDSTGGGLGASSLQPQQCAKSSNRCCVMNLLRPKWDGDVEDGGAPISAACTKLKDRDKGAFHRQVTADNENVLPCRRNAETSRWKELMSQLTAPRHDNGKWRVTMCWSKLGEMTQHHLKRSWQVSAPTIILPPRI